MMAYDMIMIIITLLDVDGIKDHDGHENNNADFDQD